MFSSNSESRELASERPLLPRDRFRFSASMFPIDLADDVAALDLFLDHCYSLIDLSSDKDEAKRKLTFCQRDFEAQTSKNPVTTSFIQLVKRHSIPDEYSKLLFEGLLEDSQTKQIEGQFDLIRHCYKVSGIPLLMLFHMLEAPENSQKFAIDLGIALELTRIARDIAPDAVKEKFYIPEEIVRPDKLILGLKKDEVWELAVLRMQKQQFDSADRYLTSALPGVRLLSQDGWLPFLYTIKACQILIAKTLNLPTNYLLDPYQLTFFDKLKSRLLARSQRKSFLSLASQEFAHNSELHTALIGLPGAHEF